MQEIDHTANPFPGLRPFESTETHLFFGRDGQSEELLRRLRRTRFLAVVGTSGSGKSSLVRAGLLPALQGGLMASAGSDWRIAILRPGSDPIGNLARALASPAVLGSGDEKDANMQAVMAETALRRSSLGLIELVSRARTKLDEKGQPLFPDYENLLVVVDQFEELFRFKQLIEEENSQEDAAAFVKLLLEAVGQKTEKIYVVLTMRSDFLGDCSQFWELPEAINNGQYLIPRMTRDERREAISGPVAVGQGTISEPLVNQLLNDVGDNPDQLPILQHALMRTWDYWLSNRRNGNPIDIPDYNAIGGMAQALSRHADEAYAELNDSQQVIAEKLFKGLTEKGTDNREIRRPMEVGEICELTEAGEAAVITVIDVFRREGRSFLMPPPTDALTGTPVQLNRESLIDISHESLIRNWSRLKSWVDDESQSARIYKRLAETAMLHHSGQEALLMDPALQGALDWREKNKPNAVWARRYHPEFTTAMSYLDASAAAREADRLEREHQRRKDVSFKRTKLAAILLALSFVVSLSASVYAYKQSGQAQAARSLAEAKLVEAESALLQATQQSQEARMARDEAAVELGKSQQAKNDAMERAEFARASEIRARASEARARQSEIRANIQLTQAVLQGDLAKREAKANRELFYSADINLAQQAYEGGDVERAKYLLTESTMNSYITPGFEWNYLSHLLNNARKTLDAPDKGLITVITSPDGNTLAIGSGHKVELRNLKTEDWKSKVITVLDDPGSESSFSIGSLAISPNGNLLAVGDGTSGTGTEDKTIVRIYDIVTGNETGSLKGNNEFSANSIAFAEDGAKLVIGGGDGVVQLWEVNSQRQPVTIPLQGTINLAVSADGNMIAFTSTSTDSERKTFPIVLWDVALNQEAGRLIGHHDTVSSVAFAADGKTLISGSLDKTVKTWEIENRKQISSVSFPRNVFSVALSPGNSDMAAIGYQDGLIKLCRARYLEAERECAALKGHNEPVTSLAFSSDGELLFSGDNQLDKSDSEEGSLNFNLSATNTGIKAWNASKLLSEQTPVRSPGFRSVRPVGYTSDSKTLAVLARRTTAEYQLALFDAETNETSKPPRRASNSAGMAISPDGEMFAVPAVNGPNLYRTSNGILITKLKTGENRLVHSLAFSPDGKILTTVDTPGALQLWDTTSHNLISKLRDDGGKVMKVAFASDGKLVALVFDKAVEFWDRTQVKQMLRFELPAGKKSAKVLSTAFSADGGILAIGYDNNQVVLYDTNTFQEKATYMAGAVYSLAFSPDGKALVTGSEDGAVKLWGTANGRELLALKGHSSRIRYVMFSPDGTKLATYDTELRIWRAPAAPSAIAYSNPLAGMIKYGQWRQPLSQQ